MNILKHLVITAVLSIPCVVMAMEQEGTPNMDAVVRHLESTEGCPTLFVGLLPEMQATVLNDTSSADHTALGFANKAHALAVVKFLSRHITKGYRQFSELPENVGKVQKIEHPDGTLFLSSSSIFDIGLEAHISSAIPMVMLFNNNESAFNESAFLALQASCAVLDNSGGNAFQKFTHLLSGGGPISVKNIKSKVCSELLAGVRQVLSLVNSDHEIADACHSTFVRLLMKSSSLCMEDVRSAAESLIKIRDSWYINLTVDHNGYCTLQNIIQVLVSPGVQTTRNFEEKKNDFFLIKKMMTHVVENLGFELEDFANSVHQQWPNFRNILRNDMQSALFIERHLDRVFK